MAIQKPSATGTTPVKWSTESSEFASLCPRLWEMLTETSYADGSKRQSSSLTVFCEDGVVKLMLNDRDNGRMAFVTQETFEMALATLEGKLAVEGLEWRKNQWAGKKGR